ncbi:MAG: 6-phosphogluconolactonase [Cytophagales bacterium CG18_big_fil_WC_8_21_14_2_50_42_9]|nr:MAG: 6-phosphogluconolactonase [Cytophagales bacterium CG18_big_fil_WC_8_21_14_2_50_42_9]
MQHKSHSRRNFLKLSGLSLAGLPLILSACSATKQSPAGTSYMVYVGTYAKPEDESIFGYRLNPATGELTRALAVKGGENPSYLMVNTRREYLYAVNEVGEYKGKKGGGLSAFTIDQKTGDLTFLIEQSTVGGSPCYISADGSGNFLFVANYMGGNVCVFPVQPNKEVGPASDMEQHIGSGKNKKRQEAAHAHCIISGPGNEFVFAVDLGLDKVYAYKLDNTSGKLSLQKKPAFTSKPGSGPRHLVFHPNGRYAYLIHELNSTMVALSYDAKTGSFKELQTISTLPEDFTGESYCADVHVSADGKFLYGSNRGHNSLVVYAIDTENGQLTLVQHADTQGDWPRNFTLDPSGQILLVANERSNNIVTYRIDTQSGMLTPTGVSVEVPAPVCLQVVPDFG